MSSRINPRAAAAREAARQRSGEFGVQAHTPPEPAAGDSGREPAQDDRIIHVPDEADCWYGPEGGILTDQAGLARARRLIDTRNQRLERAGFEGRFTLHAIPRIAQHRGRLSIVQEAVITRPDLDTPDGWRVLARFDQAGPEARQEGAAYLIRTPSEDGPRPPAPANARCDHCGTTRHRKRLYLIEHPETGQTMQIGATCVEPFLGFSTPTVDSVFDDRDEQFVPEIDELAGFGEPAYNTRDLLLAAIRETNAGRDWTSYGVARKHRGSGVESTSWLVKERAAAGDAEQHPATPDEQALIDDLLEWADRDDDTDDEFAQNVKATLRGTMQDGERWVADEHAGLAAFAVVSHRREIARRTREQAREEARGKIVQEWVGKPGDRGPLGEAHLIGLSVSEGVYGPRYIFRMRDAKGRLLTWFSSSPTKSRDALFAGYDSIDVNDAERTGFPEVPIRIDKATIKAHEEYQGDKVTIINRAEISVHPDYTPPEQSLGQ